MHIVLFVQTHSTLWAEVHHIVGTCGRDIAA